MSEKKAKNWFIGKLKQNKSLQPCDIEIIKLDLLVQFFNGLSSIQMLTLFTILTLISQTTYVVYAEKLIAPPSEQGWTK